MREYDMRMVYTSILSVIGWVAIQQLWRNLSMTKYYKREGNAIHRMLVPFWDRKGKEHFESLGFTKIKPKEE